ncbi:hypothetical protein A0H76_2540 [Hepatospora eriocheir]|uniref:Uncharacterized protein n=1 Tax=Hepatospora eriocheir TaxID=1081669 RepID=A0A1X0QJP9_9MICR|nr:hypothetical protein A0H76_2540 [Hepatospora eriocheir]
MSRNNNLNMSFNESEETLKHVDEEQSNNGSVNNRTETNEITNEILKSLIRQMSISKKTYYKYDGSTKGQEARNWLKQFSEEMEDLKDSAYLNLLQENLEGPAKCWSRVTQMKIQNKSEFNKYFLKFFKFSEDNELKVIEHINNGTRISDFVEFISTACMLREESNISYKAMVRYIEKKYEHMPFDMKLLEAKDEQELLEKVFIIETNAKSFNKKKLKNELEGKKEEIKKENNIKKDKEGGQSPNKSIDKCRNQQRMSKQVYLNLLHHLNIH